MIEGGNTTFPPICSKCLKRLGTMQWSEGAVAWVHGAWEWRCSICATEEQLAFARERAAAIPDLEGKLAELLAAEQ